MTIWIIALALLFFCSGLGYRAGAIRVAFSVVGIPVAALLAGPIAVHIYPLVKALGVTSPLLFPIVSKVIIFIIILSLFKVGGFAVHKKVDVYYRYKAGELRFNLFERLNNRLGACLGTVNALMYLIVLSTVFYMGSYWTVQMSSGDNVDLKTARYLNTIGHDLQSTGMNKVAIAANTMPDAYFQAADVVGLIYQNPLLQARVASYPGFLSLDQRPEMLAMAKDNNFTEMLMRKAPIGEVLKYERTQEILNNDELLSTLRDVVGTNLADLRTYLETGKSPKYDDPIYGEWYYDGKMSIAAYRASKPNLPSSAVAKVHRWQYAHYNKMALIVAPDGKAYLKSYPKKDSQNLTMGDSTGNWKKNESDYNLTMDGDDHVVEVEDNHMTVKGGPLPMILTKEE